MFTVAMTNGSKWAVMNEAGESKFMGTMRDCEDWLDNEENMAREAARVAPRRPVRVGRPRLNPPLFAGLRRLFDHHHKPLVH